jgi:hypothetical protein
MTSNRNIKVIDLQKNNWGTIRLEDALNSTPMFGADGIDLVGPSVGYGKRGSMFIDSKTEQNVKHFGELPEHVIPSKVFDKMVYQFEKYFNDNRIDTVPNMASRFAGVSSTGAVNLMKSMKQLQEANQKLVNARFEFATKIISKKFAEDSHTMAAPMKLTGKRGRDSQEASQFSGYYVLVTPKSVSGSTMAPVAEERVSVHEENLALLKNLPGNVEPLYTGLLEQHPNVTNVDAFQSKVNSVLKSQKQDDVNTLVAHMEKAYSTEYTPKKQLASVQFLNSFPEKSSVDTSTKAYSEVTPVEQATDVYLVDRAFYDANRESLDSDEVSYGAYNLKDLSDLHQTLQTHESSKSGISLGQFKEVHFSDIDLGQFNPKPQHANNPVYSLLWSCKLNRVFFEFLLSHDIYYPFTHLIFRPWMTFVTSSVIIMQGGQETAVNYYMKPDVMLSDNETTKTHSAHMTVHLSPFVKKANNIQVVDDVAIRRYVAGGTVKGYSPDDLMELAAAQNWVPGSHPDRPSWFSVMIPMTLNNLDSIIDFRGYFTGEEGDPEKMHFVSCALTIDSHFGVHPENYHPESPGTQWTAEDPNYNSVCAQGTQLCYNYAKKDFTAVIIGHDAPLGPNVYTGMRTVMEGLETLFVDQQYYDVSKYKVYECYQ